MSSDWIILTACIVIFGIFGVLYVIATLERIRTNRSIKIGEWQDRAHRLQNLLLSAPNNALTPTLKQAGYREIQRCLHALLMLDSQNTTAQKRLSDVKEALKKLPNELPPTLKLDPILDIVDLKEVRHKLTDLFNFVHFANKSHLIDSSTAQKEYQILKRLFTEAGVNYYLTVAKTEESQKKYRLALHHYKMALSEYNKANQNGTYNTPITEIQNAMADLTLRQEAALSAMDASAESNTSALASAVDKMQDNEDALWQKKKF